MKNHYIAALGASAGGLHALHAFFSHVQQGHGIAYVVLTHIQRDRRSILDELIGGYTNMPVTRVTAPIKVEPDHVYLLPENVFLTIKDDTLIPRERKPDEIVNRAIDTFLTSLALDAGDRAIAIIFSGSGRDGTDGAAAIKKAGGKLMVQTPSEAEFEQMPHFAITEDHPAVIDGAAQLAGDLIGYVDEAQGRRQNVPFFHNAAITPFMVSAKRLT